MSLLKIEVIFFILWSIPVVLYGLSSVYAFKRKRGETFFGEASEGVTILKPLKGVDPSLRRNLESFFQLEYPNFEIIFSVAKASDPAKKLVDDLVAANPRVNAKLIIGAAGTVPNPKVDNMLRGYEKAKNDLILVSDSNISVSPKYLLECVEEMTEGVGVLTANVKGVNGKGFFGRVEALTLNTFCTRGQMIAEIFNQSFVLGKSMMFRKSVADRFGGLRMLGRFLAEDFMTGESMKYLGLGIRVKHKEITQEVGRVSMKAYFQRHLRWARLRKAHSPIALMFEGLLSPIVSGLLGGWALNTFFGIPIFTVMAVQCLYIFLCDMFLHGLVLKGFFDIRLPLIWLAKEFNFLSVWISVWFGSSVQWRGRKIQIDGSGLINEEWTYEDSEYLPVGSSN